MPKTKHHVHLTPTAVAKLRKPEAGQRLRLMDTHVPNFGVSVTDKGTKTFFLVARFPGRASGPSRREIGKVHDISLTDARDKARKWNALIAAGKDPAIEEQRERDAQILKDATTFGAVAEKFIAEKLPDERNGHDVELSIRKDLLPIWKSKPVLDVTDADVEAVVKQKMRPRSGTARSKSGKTYKRQVGGKVAARNLYALIARIFTWAIGQAEYRRVGLKLSPCATIQKSAVLGESAQPRDRALSDDEITALWRATGKWDHPAAKVYRLLLLTALRLREASEAKRAEFDVRNGTWIIPAERMKGRNAGRKAARSHLVPLSPDIEIAIGELNRGEDKPGQLEGEFVFSNNDGYRPVYMGAKIKAEIDRRMLDELRAAAVGRGEDPQQVKLVKWTNHDIRRTCRTHFAKMKIAEEVREALLAHRPPLIKQTYNVHEYADEKRDALQMWAARLRTIVEPAPDNVVSLQLGESHELRRH